MSTKLNEWKVLRPETNKFNELRKQIVQEAIITEILIYRLEYIHVKYYNIVMNTRNFLSFSFSTHHYSNVNVVYVVLVMLMLM